MDVKGLTLTQAAEGLRDKKFSSVELTKAYLDRIKTYDKDIKSYIVVTEDQALEQAKQADAKLASGDAHVLTGVPVGVKDLFCTKGVQTTAASKILEGYVPPYSATSYDRIEKLGAVMLGKLNLDEFACGSSTETSAYLQTRNPWDLERVPGGSSGGSAAAMAADLCTYALGTDTGGSIRQPASLCGITGLKPSYGRVSRYGVVAMASSLDQVGPLTRTAEDAATVFQAMAGRDHMDSTTVDIPLPDLQQEMQQDIKGLTIGMPQEFFGEGLSTEGKAAVEAAIKKLEELGAVIKPISLPTAPYSLAVYYILMPSELSTNLSRYDGVRYGMSANAKDLMTNYMETRGKGFGDEIRRRVMLGTYALSSGYYDAYYLKAQKVRTLIKQEFDRTFESVDCIVTPTTTGPAFKAGEKSDDPLAMYLEDVYTVPVNIAGLPGISVPCGFAGELPLGMQLIGKQFDEATILRVAHQYQQVTDWHTRTPKLK